MPETVEHLIGQLADSRFPLRKLLGVSKNSAVFLTSVEPNGDAAIKLIPEDPELSGSQLERWHAARKLSHPGLLRILDSGRCVIDGSPCLYVVTELADEDLGQLLPQRGLTPEEARAMLAPVLEALDFLHENGWVHGGVKPSNIHAIGDKVKLSADRIQRAGDSASAWAVEAPFAAPEPLLFPAADLWALAATLCQTLAQRLPTQESSGRWIAPPLPPPFEEIVRSALLDDATRRISLDSVRTLLDPSFVARRRPEAGPGTPTQTADVAAPDRNSPEALIEAVQPVRAAVSRASAAVATGATSRVSARAPMPRIDPLSVPLSPVEPGSKAATRAGAMPSPRAAIPVSSLPQVNASVGGPRRAAVSRPPAERSNKLALAAGAAAVVLAILFVPKFLLRSAKTPPPASHNSAGPETTRSSAPIVSSAPSSIPLPGGGKHAASAKPVKPNNEAADVAAKAKGDRAGTTSSAPPATKPAPAPSSVKPSASGSNSKAPIVVRKILPEVSERARTTISGTVRITIKVQLNPDGTVSSAEVNAPAPSQFFADLALKAARQWQFQPSTSADSSGQGPSTAQIRFEFTQTGTAAYVL